LASSAIRGALAKLPNDLHISECIMGNVVSAGMGQAPTRQAVLYAGLPESTVCTTINKVCASGMKSVMLASQVLQCGGGGHEGVIVAGGFESMSNIPHYLKNSRTGTKLGDGSLVDGVVHDGLWDIYNDQHMGMCGEKCAKDYNISRRDQDEYALESYRRANSALKEGIFEEVVPMEIAPERGNPFVVAEDEEPRLVEAEKMGNLKPSFDRNNGTITAANASSLGDGACALVLMREKTAVEKGIRPIAKIRGFGDAAQAPVDFTTAPSLAVPIALQNAGVDASDVDYHEINEAFSVVALANIQLQNLDPTRVNVFGGAVSLGHPIGMSGARIIGTLYNALKHKDGSIGLASICNGGGGASAIVIERLE